MNFPSLTVKNASRAGILSAERWGAGSGGEPRWAPIYLMSPWSLTPQFVVAAPIFSYHINNETLGTRYLTEKLSTAGSRDETLTPLSVSLIFSPAVTATGRGRQIMSRGRVRVRWSQPEADRFRLAGGKRWAFAGAPDCPLELLCARRGQRVPLLGPRVFAAVSVLCILSRAQLHQDEFSN